jgi:ornithine carbamoyltransferase
MTAMPEMRASKRDFLTLLDFSAEELDAIVARAIALKNGGDERTLIGRTGVLLFEMKSTRTRVAFDAGMAQLGGHMVVLSPEDSQIGRGEPVEDTARVLSEMVDVIVIRTLEQKTIEALAAAATIPVINAMSSRYHPCQLLADVQTYQELRGPIADATVAFVGDGYNMCHSYINAARQWGFSLKIACPPGYQPDPQLLKSTNNVQLVETPREAVHKADLVVTDVWSSMGHEDEASERHATFSDYQINAGLLKHANDDVLLMHCLPAHRGEEVSAEMLDDPRSVVWQEAGNRLHSQKALLEFVINGGW